MTEAQVRALLSYLNDDSIQLIPRLEYIGGPVYIKYVQGGQVFYRRINQDGTFRELDGWL